MNLPISWLPSEPPFDAALRFTLFEEGDLSDDPADHGGRTKWGITQASYDAWRFRMKRPLQAVDLMSIAERDQIYTEDYWQPGSCPVLPVRLAITHFDWCVNHGPGGAKRMLQTVIGVTSDGSIGQKTLAAIYAQDLDELITAYIQARIDWYHDDVDRDVTQARFLAGWLNRCDHLKSYIGLLL